MHYAKRLYTRSIFVLWLSMFLAPAPFVESQTISSPEQRIWLPPFAAPIASQAPPLLSRELNMIGMAIAQMLESKGNKDVRQTVSMRCCRQNKTCQRMRGEYMPKVAID